MLSAVPSKQAGINASSIVSSNIVPMLPAVPAKQAGTNASSVVSSNIVPMLAVLPAVFLLPQILEPTITI